MIQNDDVPWCTLLKPVSVQFATLNNQRVYIHISMFCLMISPASWFDNSCMAFCHAEAAAQAPQGKCHCWRGTWWLATGNWLHMAITMYIYIHIHVLACVYVIDYTCILFIVKYICNHIYIVVITLNSNNKHNNNDNNNTNNNNNTHDRNATVSHMQTPWMWTIHHNISIWTLKWKNSYPWWRQKHKHTQLRSPHDHRVHCSCQSAWALGRNNLTQPLWSPGT